MTMAQQKDGFKGERSLVIPRMIIDILEKDVFCKHLHITDIGFYPHASNHYRERVDPIGQHVFLYCVDGAGWYRFGGARREILANQFVILPANLPHAYGADPDTPWTIYWMHFKGSMADAYASGLSVPRSIEPAPDSRINDRIAMFEEMYFTLRAGFNVENIRYAHTLLHHFLGSIRYVNVFRNAKGTSPDPNASNTDAAVRLAIKYMKENIGRRVTLAELAEYSGYATSHFSAVFRKIVGHAPLSYFNLLKMQAACQMLDSTDMKVSQIASRLGFEDNLYFSRLFSKIMGMSPKDYRTADRG